MLEKSRHDVGLQMVGYLQGDGQRQLTRRRQETAAATCWQEVVVYVDIDVVGAARAEHEPLHAHPQRSALRFDALPHEHATTLQTFDLARLGADLIGHTPSDSPASDPASDP